MVRFLACTRSVQLEPRVLHHLLPFGDLGAAECLQLGRCGAYGLGTYASEPLHDGRLAQHLASTVDSRFTMAGGVPAGAKMAFHS